jgi:hypothetical protein
MNTKLKGLLLGTAFSTLAFTGCETASNTNVNRVANTNNGNVAVVVNNNTATGTNTVTTTNTNANVNRADYDKNRAEYEKDKGTSSIGQGANDSWLWFKTKGALATTNDLRDSTINVDVANDVVTLRGTVATAAQKTQAETVAKGIEGVKSVKNDLQVKANDSMTNQMVNGNATNSNANTKK